VAWAQGFGICPLRFATKLGPTVSVTEPEQPTDGEEIEEFKGRATTGRGLGGSRP
jgi:hypothetical protein